MKKLLYFDLDLSEQAGCAHASVVPQFDLEKAKGKSASEVRKEWPRFYGRCPDCGMKVILYASYEHYLLGDW